MRESTQSPDETAADAVNSEMSSIVDQIEDESGERRKNESLDIAFVVGLGLALPTLTKFASKIVRAFLHGAIALVKKLPSSKGDAVVTAGESVDKRIAEMTRSFVHATEKATFKAIRHLILAAIVATFYINVDAEGASRAYDYLWNQNRKGLDAIAHSVHFGITAILAVVSVNGFIHAWHEGAQGLQAIEGGMSLAKASHITEMLAEAFSAAVKASSSLTDETVRELGLSIALAVTAKKKLSTIIEGMYDDALKAAKELRSAVQAAGVAASLASSPDDQEGPGEEKIPFKGER